MTKNMILDYLKELKRDLQKDGVVSLGLFGSFATEKNIRDSDIDIVIETSEKFIKKYPAWKAFIYIDENIRKKIEEKFGKKVDIFDKNSNTRLIESIERETCYV